MKQLETALLNADSAGDEESARMLATEIIRMRQQKPAATKAIGPVLAATSGLEQSIKTVGENLERFNPSRLVDLIPGVGKARQSLDALAKSYNASRAATAQQAEQQRPGSFSFGKGMGDVATTIPLVSGGGAALARLGGAATKVAPRMGAAAPAVKTAGRVVQQLGKSVKSGGVGVRAPTRAAVGANAPVAPTLAKRIGLRVAGGAGGAAAGAALTDQDISDAAMIGGGFPIVANIGKHGLGYVFDKLRGRVGEVRAGEIIRNLIADKSSGIIKALATAPKNIRANTAEFLAERGLLTPELAAATRIVSSGAASKPLQKVALARAEEQNAMRAQMRGADTQTGAVGNIAEAKKQVRLETEPQRIENLGKADVGRLEILPAEIKATEQSAIATNEAARARRIYAKSEDESLILGQMDDLGDTFDPQAINKQRARVSAAQQFGGEAADRAAVAGEEARSAAEIAANLREQGLAPLDISNVVSRLRQQAFNAANVSPDRANVFSAFADALERRAAQFGGVIDATGLHLARREMGQFVANTLKGSDPQTIRLGTSKLIGEAQPLIDDAIEAAGGKGWKDYLAAFSQGMRKVEQQDFGRRLTKLPEARLNKVMSGQDEEFVSDFFGPGRFDINVEYFGKDLPAAQKLSGQIGATRAVAQTGLEGLSTSQRLGLPAGAAARTEEAFKPGIANRMVQAVSNMLGGAPGVYGGGRLVSQAEQALANRLYANTMRQLAPGLANPSEALRLAQMMPTSNYFSSAINQMPSTLLGGIPRALALGGINENQLYAEEPQIKIRR
jgi:hypothetical protein